MRRDSFVFYRSFYEAIKDLPREIQGEVYTAIMEYSLNGITTECLKPVARSIFTLVKPVIDTANARSEAGAKGGRPKANGKQNESQPKANGKQNESQPKANGKQNESQPKPSESDRDRDVDRDRDRDVDGESVADATQTRDAHAYGEESPPPSHGAHGSTYTDTETLYADYRKELAAATQASDAALRLCTAYGRTITREQLGTLLDRFQDTRRTAGDTHATHSDYRRHFTNWLRIQIQNGNDKQNRTSNGNSTAHRTEADRRRVTKPTGGYTADF